MARNRVRRLVLICLLTLVITGLCIYAVRDVRGVCPPNEIGGVHSRLVELNDLHVTTDVHWTEYRWLREPRIVLITHSDVRSVEQWTGQTGGLRTQLEYPFVRELTPRLGQECTKYSKYSQTHRVSYELVLFDDGYIVISAILHP